MLCINKTDEKEKPRLPFVESRMLNNLSIFPQGNHQSELIEHRISSIKVIALSKKNLLQILVQ